MESNNFIENIRQQFLEPDDVTLDMATNFRDIDSYDSLTGMTIMVMLKDEYGIDISDEEYRSKQTVQDLYDFVVSKNN